MKKIAWIFGFLALTFVGDRVGGYLLSEIVERSQFRYSRIYSGQAESDILLVGNSRGLMFYQPYIEEKTGKETLNISYNGMPISVARVLVQDYLDRYPAPQKMILDVTMCDRDNRALVGAFNPYVRYSPHLAELLREETPNAYWAGKVSHLYRYNGEIFQRAAFYLRRSDEDWLLDRVITDALVDEIADREVDTITIEPKVIDDLVRTVKIAQLAGVEVELVINPYYPAFVDKLSNLDELKDTVEAATGLPVRNYARAVVAQNGFGDYQHLNKEGSREYLRILLAEGILE